jgi:hypothetical protein
MLQQAMGVAGDLAPAMGIAAVVAAIAILLCSWPFRTPSSRIFALATVLCLCLGFNAGWRWLKVQPHWPPREDQDRFLLILVPILVAVELLAGLFHSEIPNSQSENRISNPSDRIRNLAQLLIWLPRLAVAAVAGRILLHDTSYISDLSGPGSRQWTSDQTWMILGGLAAVLAGAWIMLTVLLRREPGRAVPLAIAISCSGSAVTIMMSGYASGGPLAIPLAGALLGVWTASLFIKSQIPLDGLVGFGLVGLFGILIMGLFFGELTWVNAELLFFAPLLCWIPELPPFQKFGTRVRSFAGVGLATVLVVIALTLAQQQFVKDSTQPSPDSQEPTLEDYMNFGR